MGYTEDHIKAKKMAGNIPIELMFNNRSNGSTGGYSAPSNFSVTWINDFARISFDDNSGRLAQHEIWESKNGGNYELAYTIGAGVITYDYYTWQNASLNFKIRAKKYGVYSQFTPVINIVTPLVWKTNQTTLNQAKFNALNITAGKTINVDWGDGNNNNYTGNNANITHDYSVTQNPYYIKITGDINSITQIYVYSWTTCYGNITKWVIPTALTSLYFAGGTDKLSGTANNLVTHTAMQYLTMSRCNLSGDLSSENITATMKEIRFIENELITGLPRGNYSGVSAFDFRGCDVISSELESWLSYLHTFFDSNAPVKNAIYNISGSRMGIIDPSNADLTAIIADYIAEGKTCTIDTYWPEVAYTDRTTKVIIPLVTPDGFGETVHPSVLDVGAGGWSGYRYWLADTPYHNADPAYEFPCIWASNDGLNWEVPIGGSNPVVGVIHPDTDIFFEANTLYLYYTGGGNLIKRSHSNDGITWGGEITIMDSTPESQPLSPSIVKVGATYYLYYVENLGTSTRHIKRRSSASIDGPFITPQDVILANVAVQGWWHLDMLMVGGVYWMCVSVGGGNWLYIAKSVDGINFTRDDDNSPPIINTLDDEGGFYKPTMMYIGAQLYVYYSCYIGGKLTIVRVDGTLIP